MIAIRLPDPDSLPFGAPTWPAQMGLTYCPAGKCWRSHLGHELKKISAGIWRVNKDFWYAPKWLRTSKTTPAAIDRDLLRQLTALLEDE